MTADYKLSCTVPNVPLTTKKWRPDRLTDERIGWGGGGDGEELVR